MSWNQVGKVPSGNVQRKDEWPPWLVLAHHDCLDCVQEIPGPKYHARIVEYLSSVRGLTQFKSDEIAWCSSALNFWMKTTNYPHTDSPLARSWMTVGREAVIPKEGDIAVFFDKRNDVHGHVGIYIMHSDNQKRILVLGGNQGDEVCYLWMPVDGANLFLKSIRTLDIYPA